ncbi:hypothetical protein AALP_AA3G177000 [Arabis alpina]|uniref:Uncharacterized protein n=1 Tax=Arabis alpina TaxID=50452 RepID=A0A087H9W1_ARAAL|nr:hypothetical protein AALP_AA3G177000 [Arabis alpina]
MTGSKISVLILRLWRKNFKGGGPMEMILVDSQGDRIHATVDSDLASKYDAKLREGLAVTIESFKVTPYVGDYRTNPHPFKISFFRTTDVLKCEKFPSVVPEKYIADFTRINTSVMDKAIMIDVVGQIVDVQPLTEIISKGKNLSKLDFYFVDELSTKLLCTFWGDYAKAFWKFISQHKDTQVVCLIRFVAVKEYRSSWHVTNSYDATQYFYNSDIPTIKRFNTMLPPDSLSLTINNSAPPTVPLYQEFFELNKKKSIYDIVYSNERGAAELAQEIAHDDQAILPLAIKQLVGQTMLFKDSTLINIDGDSMELKIDSVVPLDLKRSP